MIEGCQAAHPESVEAIDLEIMSPVQPLDSSFESYQRKAPKGCCSLPRRFMNEIRDTYSEVEHSRQMFEDQIQDEKKHAIEG